MAVIDDLNRLAAQDVVYLSRSYSAATPLPGEFNATQVFRGRLRQALDGNWVFNAFTGQNGVVGFNLGPIMQYWSSGESPAGGIEVTINGPVIQNVLNELITLTTLIPSDFSE